MQCPSCHTEYSANDLHCRNCGAHLPTASTSVVKAPIRLPAILSNPYLPRLAAGVAVVGVGIGIELLRRTLTRPSQPVAHALPTLNGVRDLLLPQINKQLPRSYEIHETILYMRRIIRREE